MRERRDQETLVVLSPLPAEAPRGPRAPRATGTSVLLPQEPRAPSSLTQTAAN